MKKKIKEKIKQILENNYIEDSPDLILELFEEELKEQLLYPMEGKLFVGNAIKKPILMVGKNTIDKIIEEKQGGKTMTKQTNWENRKISEEAKKTAHHIGIISEGAIQTLIDEIRQQEQEKSYQKGFINGADSTGRQAEEVMAIKIKEIEGLKKKQTKHFSGGIEVEHHGQRPCNENCVPNGKEQGGEFNQALSQVLSILKQKK